MNIRAFLAVTISPAVQAGAASLIDKLAKRTSGVKWVAPENLHITIKFFGDIRVEATHAISRAASQVASQLDPFEIVVSGAGAFPDMNRARTVWLGVSQGREPFIELAQAIDEPLAELGYPPERRQFHPHLTIGRVRGRQTDGTLASLLEELHECHIGVSYVEEIVLLSSTLDRSGPTYSRLATIEL